MPKLRTLFIAGALGAAASYFFDPERGRGRRTRARDQLGGWLRSGRRNLEGRATQVGGRARGAVTQLQHAHDERSDDDLTVLSRVESEVMGRPGFPKGRVNADVVGGRLTLRGDLESEEQIRDIVEAAGRVSGVVMVVNLLHLPGTPAPTENEVPRT